MKRTLILILGLALVVASCGGDDDPAAPTTTNPGDITTTTAGDDAPPTTTDDDISVPPTDPGSVVLKVHNEGGFLPVEMAYNPTPLYMLLGDGRLIAPGMIPLIFPGPLMMPLQVIQLDDATVAQILEQVEAIGLPGMTDERASDAENVADAGDTVVTFFDAEGEHRFAVYALGAEMGDDPRITATNDLMAALEAATAGGEPAGEFAPDAVQVLVSPSLDAEKEAGSEIKDWPLPVGVAEIPEIGGQTGLRCLALEGEDAAFALEVFTESTQVTFFEEGDAVWRLTPRPLFPGEVGCPN